MLCYQILGVNLKIALFHRTAQYIIVGVNRIDLNILHMTHTIPLIIESKISVSTATSIEFINIDDVLYISRSDNHTLYVLVDGRHILSQSPYAKLSYLMEEYGFNRCHPSYSIQLRQVVKYMRMGEVVMSNGDHVPVHKASRDSLLFALSDLTLNLLQ